MLPTNLNTNEIKNKLGVEEEFLAYDKNGRMTEFQLKDEIQSQPHRIKARHQETGKPLTTSARRQSNINFIVTEVSEVDPTQLAVAKGNISVDLPTGHMLTNAIADKLVARMVSGFASDGTSTTVKYDGSGTFAVVLRLGQS